jgi:hypothetical protein
MENQNRVSDYWGSQGNKTRGTQVVDLNLNTFLTIFTINIVHRFPNVRELDHIPVDEIRNIAEFSTACTNIALETWTRVRETTSSQDVRRAA